MNVFESLQPKRKERCKKSAMKKWRTREAKQKTQKKNTGMELGIGLAFNKINGIKSRELFNCTTIELSGQALPDEDKLLAQLLRTLKVAIGQKGVLNCVELLPQFNTINFIESKPDSLERLSPCGGSHLT